MRNLLILALLCFLAPSPLQAQRSLNESFPLNGAKKVKLAFTWPELIVISEGTGNQITISGSVLINNGENDDAFQFKTETIDGELKLSSFLKDKDKIPKRIKIGHGEEEVYFKAESMDDPIVQKYLEEHGKSYKYVNQGIIKEIVLKVEVPRGVELEVESKYGVVEVDEYSGPALFHSKYGAVDYTVKTSDNVEIKARTKYGDVFTDLDIDIIPNPKFVRGVGKWMTITGTLGNGSRITTLESQYGNVYIRKKN